MSGTHISADTTSASQNMFRKNFRSLPRGPAKAGNRFCQCRPSVWHHMFRGTGKVPSQPV